MGGVNIKRLPEERDTMIRQAEKAQLVDERSREEGLG